MTSKSVRVLTLLALTSVAACGETVLEPGDLSEAEAVDMAGAVLYATFASTMAPPQQQGGFAAVEYEYAADVATTVACPLGGEVAVMADVEVTGETETETVRVEYTMTQTHSSCVVQSEEGREFTLTGDPNLSFNLVVEADGMEGVIDWGGDVQGTINWSTDGMEGSCPVSFDFGGGIEGQSTSISGSMGGTVCGHEFNRSFSVSGATAS